MKVGTFYLSSSISFLPLSVHKSLIENNIKNMGVGDYDAMNIETGNPRTLEREIRREIMQRPDECNTHEDGEIVGEEMQNVMDMELYIIL